MLKNIKIMIGDVRTTLKELPDEFVNCCITSPPYFGLRCYDTAEWEGGDPECDHVANPSNVKTFGNAEFNKNRPCLEETKVKGYYYDKVCAKCGAIKIDYQIGNEDTPAEYINSLVEVFREVKRVLRPDGLCFINLGDSYAVSGIKKETGLKPSDLIGIPWQLAFALRDDGWYLRQDIIWAKGCSGVYDGGAILPESTKSRFSKSHEYIFMLAKNRKYHFDAEAVAEVVKDITIQRAFSNNNMDKRKGQGDEPFSINGKSQSYCYARMRERIAAGEIIKRNRRSVWTVGVRPSTVSHFASYPYELIEPLILAGCPVDGTVLDPFGGTGTTAIASVLLNRKAIHCELSQKYIGVIEERFKEILKQKSIDGVPVHNGKILKPRELF